MYNSRNGSIWISLLLIFLGVTILLGVIFPQVKVWALIWPLFILIPGIAFELSFFQRPTPIRAGLLVPGGILCTIGLLFLFLGFTDYAYMAFLWPVFILAPAVGLFQLYLFGMRIPALMIPVSILSIISAFFFMLSMSSTAPGALVFGAFLIFVGIVILSGVFRKKY